jgi:hypothetical protein
LAAAVRHVLGCAVPLRFPACSRAAAALQLAGAGGAQLYVALFCNPLTYSDDLTFDDLEAPSWPDYSDYNSALWTGPTADVNGDYFFLSPSLTWTRGAGGSAETVYGYAVSLGPPDVTNLLALDTLVAPVPMVAPAHFVNLYPIKLAVRGLAY